VGDRKQNYYGWVRDLPDRRDYEYAPPPALARTRPRRVDLRPQCPPVYDQGQLQSCTANAVGAAIQYMRRMENLAPDFRPSRMFIYFNTRAARGCERCDTGSPIRDAVKSVAALGVCPEELWPYRVPRFETKPAPGCFRAAKRHRAISYHRVPRDPDLTAIRTCLASGHPVVFGMAVYKSFEAAAVARSGVAVLPQRGEQHIGHGHAVLAVGYDDGARRLLARNSWGEGWGQRGYFTLPYAYLADPHLSDDFWTIRAVTR